MDNKIKNIAQEFIQNTQDKDAIQKEKNKKIKKAFSLFDRKSDIKSVFEDVSNCNYIFSIQRKIFDFATYGFVISLIINLVCFIAIFFVLLPLKEKEPYLVAFSNNEQNFANVQKADFSITANEALKRQLVGAYILGRETINRIDDQQRYELVRHQSSLNVWRNFEALMEDQKSIYTNESLTRSVKIVNISLKNKTYATADVEITLYQNGKIESIKRYIISLIYSFEPINFDFKSLPINPTGFIVSKYAVTEMEILKELPEENQVKRNTIDSKVIRLKPSKEDKENILQDAYLFQQQKQEKEENHKQEEVVE